MKLLIEVLRPVLIQILVSKAAKETLIDILRKLAERSDNKIDDTLVEGVARALEV